MILLDTQAFVWLFTGDAKLGPRSREAVETACDEAGAYVSVMSFWEISMLAKKGRLIFDVDIADWIESALARPGIRSVPLEPIVALDAGRLPGNIHGDPADRIIAATARSLECPLLTTDRKILAYANQGHVQAIDARI